VNLAPEFIPQTRAFRFGRDRLGQGARIPSRRLERKALRGLRDAQPPAADQDIHMRERPAEGEDELMQSSLCIA
jgi:hypothetical protein